MVGSTVEVRDGAGEERVRTAQWSWGVQFTVEDQERAFDGEHGRGGGIRLAEVGMKKRDGAFPCIVENGRNRIFALQPIGMQQVFPEMDSDGGLVGEGEIDGGNSVLEIAEIESGAESFDRHVFDETGTGDAAAQSNCAVCLSIGVQEADIFDCPDVADGPIDGNSARIVVSDGDGQILNMISESLVSAAIDGIVFLLEAAGCQESSRLTGV